MRDMAQERKGKAKEKVWFYLNAHKTDNTNCSTTTLPKLLRKGIM